MSKLLAAGYTFLDPSNAGFHMPQRDPDLHVAMKRYVLSALKFITSNVHTIPLHTLTGHSVFFAGSPTGRGAVGMKTWHTPLLHFDQQVHALPEYTEVISRLRANPVSARQLDNFVGNGDLHTQRRVQDFADGVLWGLPFRHIPTMDEATEMVEDKFDGLYEDFERDFYSDTMAVNALMPLYCFYSDANRVPLAPGISIDRYSTSETDHVGSFLPKARWNIGPQTAIRVRYESPKIVGPADEEASERASAQRRDAVETLERTMIALTAFKAGPVVPQAIIVHSRSVPGTAHLQIGSNSGAAAFHTPSQAYRLEQSDIPAFIEFWSRVQSGHIRKHGPLELALRRISFANGRTHPEDAVVDLVIAAESLLLSGSDDPKYRSEIRYRFSTNAALAATDGAAIEETYRLFRTAYDLRSTIVHGGGDPLKPKLPNGNLISVEEFVGVFEERLRVLLHRAIERANDPQTPKSKLFDWERLLLDRLTS